MKMLFGISFLLILLASGASVVYLIKQKEIVYKWSRRLLLGAFVFLSISLVFKYFYLELSLPLALKAPLIFFAWVIMGVYLIFQLKFRVMVLGSFIIPFTAFLMIISTSIPGIEIAVRPVLRSIWLMVHVITVFIGDSMFVITFMAAIMYLIQENQIKNKKIGSFFTRLPSLGTLDSINHYSLIWGFPFLTLGLITGAIYAQNAIGSYWQWDPKEVWSLITWLAYAVLLHERLAVGWRGRRAALMSIVCFLILIFTFIGGSLWLSDYHSFKSLEGRVGL